MLPKIDWSNPDQVTTLIKATKLQIASLMKRDFATVWEEILTAVNEKVKAIQSQQSDYIPQVDIQDILNQRVSQETLDQFQERGAMVVRNVIPQEQVQEWYQGLKDYLKENDYENQKIDPNLDTYFSGLKSHKPQIFNIFWSKCQVHIRQHPHLALTKKFLNQFWISGNDQEKYFEPDKETIYSDRIRIRMPGDTTLGLSPHIDGGSVERWIDDCNLKIYEKIFTGNWQNYFPFNGAHRNQVENIASPAVCRAFRTYQAWVALTPQGPHDGTLQLVPMLKEATAFLLLRPFLADVDESILCGALPCKAQAINSQWHAPLLKGLISIPKMMPGDTVWWHADLIHAVENEHQGQVESSVTYVGSAPLCQRNQDFLNLQKESFLSGKSSPDFAAENREVHYKNRATVEDLSELGKKQMGLVPWN